MRRCKDPLTKLAQIIKIQFSHLFEANINGFLIQLRIYIVKLWTHAPQSNFLHVHVVSGKFSQIIAVADPGFSPGGGANSQNCYYFSHFCRKLHENERIWTPGGGGGARPWRPPLDPPMNRLELSPLG